MRKHSFIYIFLVVVLALTITVPAMAADDVSVSSFKDMPKETNWAFDGILYCVENGLMVGKSSTTFDPNGTLTRAELATVLYRLDGSPAVTSSANFTDVPSGKWFSKPVAWASQEGIVKGYADGSFKPNAPVTRQELATMFYRYMGQPSVSGSLDFPDVGDVNSYAKASMTWAVENGLIYGSKVNGQTILSPTSTATRAQVATILMRFCKTLIYEVTLEAYEGLDDYDVGRRIVTDYDTIIRPYLNEEGTLPNDEAVLSEAGNAVYQWAQELEDAGYIDGCSYNDTGKSVAFFLHDGTTSVYFPPVKDCCSGAYDYTVTGITTLTLVDDAVISTITGFGSDDAAKHVGDNAPEYTQVDNLKRGMCTVPYLREYFGSLDENNVRTIFWRSHGGLYTDRLGVQRVSFILNDKITEDKDQDYDEYLHTVGDTAASVAKSDEYYAVNSKFFELYMSEVDGGLFYCGACYSGADGGVAASTFIDKGFHAYAGAGGSIFTFYSDDFMETVTETLCEMDDTNGNYKTIEDAFIAARSEHGDRDIYGISMNLWQNSDLDTFRLADPIGYKKAYGELLKDQYAGSGYKFQFVFIDDDDIPELMISGGFHHAAEVYLYTYHEGEAKYLGNFSGNYGCLSFSERNNSVVRGYMQMGIGIYTYYKIEDGALKTVIDFDVLTSGNKTTYYINGIAVPESVFRARAEQIHGENEYIERGYSGLQVTDKDIKKMYQDWDYAIVD